MSQDLFAAFGDTSSDTQKVTQTSQPSFSFFDDFNSSQTPQQQQPQPVYTQGFASLQPQGPPKAAEDDGDDDFGDFEDAAPPTTVSAEGAVESSSSIWDDGISAASKAQTAAEPSPLSSIANATQAQHTSSRTGVEPPRPRRQSPPRRSAAPRDPDVLFDAEDEELEDDFGDFEEPDEEPAVVVAAEAPDLLGLGDSSGPGVFTSKSQPPAQQDRPQASSLLDLESLNFMDDAPVSPAAASQPPTKSLDKGHSRHSSSHNSAVAGPTAKPATLQEHSVWDSEPSPPMSPPGLMRSNIQQASNPPAKQEDEPWDDFNAWDQPSPPRSSAPPTIKPASSSAPASKPEEPWDDFNAWEQEAPAPTSLKSPTLPKSPPPFPSERRDPSPNELPPSNVPPPAVLLSLFPEIFASAEVHFFKPTSSEPQAVRSQIFADPATGTYLQGLAALATVCARIVAGRKHRWKRDALLTQSMRIGPASSGRASGMKVASIDKSEIAKEDREVADVIRAWQAQVGRLKSAIAEAKKAGSADIGPVPELRETMPIRTAKQTEGGVPGFKACVVCGLKRDERVAKVDFDVMDSFGEWWLDGLNVHRGRAELLPSLPVSCFHLTALLTLWTVKPVGIFGRSTRIVYGRGEGGVCLHMGSPGSGSTVLDV
jgi:hypothetical protein